MIFLIFDALPLITNNNLRSSSYRLLSKLQAWKVQEGRIQETQVRASNILQWSIRPLSVILIFTCRNRALSGRKRASGGRRETAKEGEVGNAPRHSGNARGMYANTMEEGLLTLKHGKLRGPISIKLPRSLPDQSRYAWNIQKQNDYSLKGGDARRKYRSGRGTKITSGGAGGCRGWRKRDANKSMNIRWLKAPTGRKIFSGITVLRVCQRDSAMLI